MKTIHNIFLKNVIRATLHHVEENPDLDASYPCLVELKRSLIGMVWKFEQENIGSRAGEDSGSR